MLPDHLNPGMEALRLAGQPVRGPQLRVGDRIGTSNMAMSTIRGVTNAFVSSVAPKVIPSIDRDRTRTTLHWLVRRREGRSFIRQIRLLRYDRRVRQSPPRIHKPTSLKIFRRSQKAVMPWHSIHVVRVGKLVPECTLARCQHHHRPRSVAKKPTSLPQNKSSLCVSPSLSPPDSK